MAPLFNVLRITHLYLRENVEFSFIKAYLLFNIDSKGSWTPEYVNDIAKVRNRRIVFLLLFLFFFFVFFSYKTFVNANSILKLGTTIYLTRMNSAYPGPASLTQSYSENEVFIGGTFCFLNAATLPFEAMLLSRALRKEAGTCSRYVNSSVITAS